MPQVRFASGAVRDLQRLREFLRPKNPIAAQRAGQTIIKAVQVLGLQPHIGRPIEDMPDEFREWVIDFGDSGYVARYRIDVDAVTILAVRHQKEVGF
jgi:plasmid stabilization system protein ParE